jgi:hypothetical protein
MTLNLESSYFAEFGASMERVAEPDDRSKERPYEPTPLFLNLVKDRQSVIRDQMLDILENRRPDYVSDELYSFIEIIYMSRDANRDVKNAESYGNRLFDEDTIQSPLINDAIERAKYGTASAEELFVVAQTLGMSSIELAKLTHIYGYRLEHIEAMRRDVAGAIELNGGEVFHGEDVEEGFTLIGFDRTITNSNRPCHGLVMRRKRTVGRVDNYDVFERSSFVVNLDKKSGTKLSPDLLRYLNNYEVNAKNEVIVKGKPVWSQDIMKNSSLRKEVKRCIERDDLVSVVPISTTVYAFNPEIEELQSIREEERRRKSREEFEQSAPSITSLQKLQD